MLAINNLSTKVKRFQAERGAHNFYILFTQKICRMRFSGGVTMARI